jgi:hypothetical protein
MIIAKATFANKPCKTAEALSKHFLSVCHSFCSGTFSSRTKCIEVYL